jgi:hypothetical protein
MAAKVVLRRETPPPRAPRGHGKGQGREPKWPGLLAAVAAGRGAWFRVGEYANVNSANSASRSARRYDTDRFEFTARTEGDKGVLYARLKTA